ncbi:hypothetical protein SUGI_0878700 [Cryptomeria japonica]|uniref:protein NRT1/ PTR FAMILY 5.6 n=1 Tax=Cryptomeria japonica TaxID=3369 RepID=UPI0024147D7C|nr:protein NRT1/ PTR FAMILY 5.6 [Cryptomeria japonica]GLJ42407.1 hypothetical protein SUGI_0878700 [Cryptomeria japonica]
MAVEPNRGQEWVNDGSVDIKGRPVLRAKTGGWKASLFIIGVEVTERLTYYGIAANLITYLTTVLQEGVATSAKNVNYWTGVTTVMPLVGGFLADSYCGRYWMVLAASIIYLLGLVLLTLSVSLPALKPPRCEKGTVGCSSEATPLQIGIFFLALYLISFGTGGHKPSLQAFGADQFDEQDENERIKKTSFFNWWFFGLSSGILLAVTLIVYIQDNVSWGCGFGILTFAMVVAIALFTYGTPFYRHKVPSRSPIVGIAKVFVAAIRNRSKSLPSDENLFNEVGDVESMKSGQRLLSHTDNFKFLDKAAIIDPPVGMNRASTTIEIGPANLKTHACTVTQVEEVKLILRMVPIWLSCLMFGVTIAQTNTFFIKQGKTMNRRFPNTHNEIPPASLFAFSVLSMITFVAIYDSCFVPIARYMTGNKRGITILQRIGLGMIISILSMVTAALVEAKRLNVAKNHGLLENPKATIPLSVFWLAPQFALNGIADVFTIVGLQEYFYDQAPDSMRSLGIAFYLSVIGVSSFLSSFIISIVDRISTRGGHEGWFVNNINKCHLDYFYWLLAILSALNIIFYGCMAHRHTYKKVKHVYCEKGILPIKKSHHDENVTV